MTSICTNDKYLQTYVWYIHIICWNISVMQGVALSSFVFWQLSVKEIHAKRQ